MTEIIRVPLAAGGSILVEGTTGGGGPVMTGRLRDSIVDASTTLQGALGSIAAAATAVLSEVRRAGPHTVEVEFGVAITAEIGAVVAKAASESHFTVTLTWGREDAAAEPTT